MSDDNKNVENKDEKKDTPAIKHMSDIWKNTGLRLHHSKEYMEKEKKRKAEEKKKKDAAAAEAKKKAEAEKNTKSEEKSSKKKKSEEVQIEKKTKKKRIKDDINFVAKSIIADAEASFAANNKTAASRTTKFVADAVLNRRERIKKEGFEKWCKDNIGKDSKMSEDQKKEAYEKYRSEHPSEFESTVYFGKDDKFKQEIQSAWDLTASSNATAENLGWNKSMTNELRQHPSEIITEAAQYYVDKKLDSVVDAQIEKTCQKYHISLNGGTGKLTDEQRQRIRDTIRGTKNSIFRNSEIRKELFKSAYKGIEDLIDKHLEGYADNLTGKVLKPMNKLKDKLDKIDEFLNYEEKQEEKYNITKIVCDKITGRSTDKIYSSISKINSKLGIFGLEDEDIHALSDTLGAQIGESVKKMIPVINKNIKAVSIIADKIKLYKTTLTNLKTAVKTQISAWRNKATGWVKDRVSAWAKKTLEGSAMKVAGLKLKI